ncbi:Chemotaxis protein CheC, inhibitor of MCP methylation CheC [Thiovulum sp. ES]|nr:Chemotaxis protein CheC, inhibitor of MCP methylation CheC [Thiovulum sp. ES]
MKATIRKEIAVFYPNKTFVDSGNVNDVLSSDDLKSTVFNKRVSTVLVSLKFVHYFNAIGISIIVERLNWIQEEWKQKMEAKKPLRVGFCDLNEEKHNLLNHIFGKEPNFDIYKTFEIAMLFSTKAFGRNDEKILLWNSDYEQRTYQGFELLENNHNLLIAHSEKDFTNYFTSPKMHFSMVVRDSYINIAKKVKFATVHENSIIYNFEGYIDSRIDFKFNMIYHDEAIASGFKLFIFDLNSVVGMNAKGKLFFEKIKESSKSVNIVVTETGKNSLNTKKEFEKLDIPIFKDLKTILENKPLFKSLGGEIVDTKKRKHGISKDLIEQIPIFLNATISTFEVMLQFMAKKRNPPKVQKLDVSEIHGKIMIASIAFHGDLEGFIILVFPYRLAKHSSQIIIDGEIETVAEVLDTIGEFTNIIAGRTKADFSEEGIGISITLPKTYTSIESLGKVINLTRVGVQMDLSFDDENFIFFLTR